MFWNNGRLAAGWTIEHFTSKHASQPFNPDIANAFFRAGMIEAWGRGIEKMQADCKAQGVPGPALRYETNGLWVEFENRTSEEATGETGEKTREKILALVVANPSITTEELSDQVGITVKGIEWQISKLKQSGFLERVGPAKGGYWRVIGGETTGH